MSNNKHQTTDESEQKFKGQARVHSIFFILSTSHEKTNINSLLIHLKMLSDFMNLTVALQAHWFLENVNP